MSYLELLKEFNFDGLLDEKITAIAAKVYLDLKDVIKIRAIEKHYDPNLKLIYLIGNDGDKKNVYLPVSSMDEINLLKLELIESTLCTRNDNLMLSICDPSSIILYYNITKNWIDNK